MRRARDERYKNICTDCGQEAIVSRTGMFIKHENTAGETCVGSGLRDLDPPDGCVWGMGGGLPTLGKGHH